MIKIVNSNLIIDLCPHERYLKYLPQQHRFIEVKKYTFQPHGDDRGQLIAIEENKE